LVADVVGEGSLRAALGALLSVEEESLGAGGAGGSFVAGLAVSLAA
jgi:hypothetical protein